MHLLQTCIDGETWETIDSSGDMAKLVTKKKAMDHQGVDNFADIRIVDEDDLGPCGECNLPLSQCCCAGIEDNSREVIYPRNNG